MATTSIWSVKGWLGKVVIYVENPDEHPWLEVSLSSTYRPNIPGKKYEDAEGNTLAPNMIASSRIVGEGAMSGYFYVHTDEYVPDHNAEGDNNIGEESWRSGTIVLRDLTTRDTTHFVVYQRPAQYVKMHVDQLIGSDFDNEYFVEYELEQKNITWGFLMYGANPVMTSMINDRWDGLSNTRKLYQEAIKVGRDIDSQDPDEGIYWGAYNGYYTVEETYPRLENMQEIIDRIPDDHLIKYVLSKNRDRNGNGYIDYDEIVWYVPALDELAELYRVLENKTVFFQNSEDRFHSSTPYLAGYTAEVPGRAFYVKMGDEGEKAFAMRDRQYNVICCRRKGAFAAGRGIDAVDGVQIRRIQIGDVLGEKGEFRSDGLLGIGLQRIEQLAAPARQRQGRIVERVVVRGVEADVRSAPADLVVETSVRTEGGEPVLALDHQLAPFLRRGTRHVEDFAGIVAQHVGVVRFGVEVHVGAAPDVFGSDFTAVALSVVGRGFVNQVPLIVEEDVPAVLLHGGDMVTERVGAAERRGDLEVRVLVVMPGMIPAEEAERIAPVRLRMLMQRAERVVRPHLKAELLFVDDEEKPRHVADPFRDGVLRTVCPHPFGIVARAFVPGARIQVEHRIADLERLPGAQAEIPLDLQRHRILSGFSLHTEVRRKEVPVPAAQEERADIIGERHPAHGRGGRMLRRDGVGAVFVIAGASAQVASDVLVAEPGLRRHQQRRSGPRQRADFSDARVGEVENLRFRIVPDGCAKGEPLIRAQRNSQRERDGQRVQALPVECHQRIVPDAEGVAVRLDVRPGLPLRGNERLHAVAEAERHPEAVGKRFRDGIGGSSGGGQGKKPRLIVKFGTGGFAVEVVRHAYGRKAKPFPDGKRTGWKEGGQKESHESPGRFVAGRGISGGRPVCREFPPSGQRGGATPDSCLRG